MDPLTFPISGVTALPLWPPLVALIVSFFTSMGGLSGAFLLLPFQVSVLAFTGPAASATNLVYNIVAIPGGVYRYLREGRLSWPLAALTLIGTLPGVFLGFFLRVRFLPDASGFKLFVGAVLGLLGLRLAIDLIRERRTAAAGDADSSRRLATIPAAERSLRTVRWTARRVTFVFCRSEFSFSAPGVTLLALAVGVIGGVYGIGGGAIIAPFLVAVWGLPVYAVAGAALLGTLLTSVVGVAFYSLAGPFVAPAGTAVQPDWLLGGLFGVGGLIGTYLGARCQKYFPARAIKSGLAVLLLLLAAGYLLRVL